MSNASSRATLRSSSSDPQGRRQPRSGRRLLAAAAAATVLLLGVQLFGGVGAADAHGAATRPGSRTYLCRIDGTHNSGDIEPSNPACAAAVALGGKQPLWDWFGVLRADGAGRTRGYIPDGQLCSGGEPKYAGYDLARADWPYTNLTSGAEFTFRYNAWAAHPGEFRMYITKDGYDPNTPLRWDDLVEEPFSVYAEDTPNGQDEQNGTPDYQWTATLPQRSGQHIIYSVWERSDSTETFYNCSDVRFEGGNGEVAGVGPGANPVGPPGPGSSPATTVAPGPETSVTNPTSPANSPSTEADTGAGTETGNDNATDTGTDDGTMAADSNGQAATELPAVGADSQSGALVPSVGDNPDSSVDGAGEAKTSNGFGWLAMAVVALVGVMFGIVLTIAFDARRNVAKLERRLADYDSARPQPAWDRLDDDQPSADEATALLK